MDDGGMPEVIFSRHAVIQMQERGAEEHEVIAAIREGDREPARGNRVMYRKNFAFDKVWREHKYGIKQVASVVVEEHYGLVVVTVYVFYF
jgi:hypothetical protein